MAKHRANRMKASPILAIGAILSLIASFFGVAQVASAAAPALTVVSKGWNVIGLDSNDVTDGPNSFPQEFKVCNTSSDTAATDVVAEWTWTSANSYISLDGNATKTIGTLAANSCKSFWWTVTVARNASAYDTSRLYTVDVQDGGSATASTGTKLVYVEHLISQNRNAVDSVSGPASVTVGQTLQFVLTGSTATQGYEQIVTAPILNSGIFEITSVVGTYAVGGSISNFYFDACSWDPAGSDPTTWDCLSTGKAGGDPIIVTVTAKAIGVGSAAIGGIIYDFSGSSFHYNSDYSAGVLNVTVSAPVITVAATDDAKTTDVDTPVEVDLLLNDSASNGTLDPASVNVTVAPSHGSVTIDPATGKATYSPASGYTGTDTFTYEVCTVEDATKCDTAVVTITINPAAPVITVDATDDSKATDVDTPVEVDLLLNDSASNGTLDPASVHVTVAPSHGSVTIDPATGKATYTPASGYTGTDTFTYEVCSVEDATKCDTAVATITIDPALTPPTAVDDADSTDVDTPVEIDVLGNDTVGTNSLDPASVVVTVQPSHGSVTIDPTTGKITYTPASGYTGTDTFTYAVCDTGSPQNCDTAEVTVTINPAAPVISVDAVDDAETTDIDTPVDVDLLDNDSAANGTLAPASVNVTVAPAHGSVTIDPATGKATYTPASGYSGTDVFTYEVCSVEDATVCDTAVATITINPAVTPPTAVDDADSTDVDTPVEIDVLGNDTVGTNSLDPASVVVTVQPSHGSVTIDPTTGKITYTPASGYSGTDVFTYAVCDTGKPQNCDTAEVTVTINLAAPAITVAATDDSKTTELNTAVEVDLLVNDSATNGTLDPASVEVTVDPAHGSVTIDPTTGKAIYTPADGYSGTDTFTYEVCSVEDATVCDTAVVTITINPAPPAEPEEVVKDDELNVDEPVTIDPTTVDPTAPAIDPLTTEIVEQPKNGTVTVDPATGQITYTPNKGYKGTDSFVFKAAKVGDPTTFVTFTYNVTIAGDPSEVEKTDSELAATGSNSLYAILFGLVLASMGAYLLKRRKA